MPHEKLAAGEIEALIDDGATTWRSTGSSTRFVAYIHTGAYGVAGIEAELEEVGSAVRRKGWR